jgi:chromosomal replication initiator protein
MVTGRAVRRGTVVWGRFCPVVSVTGSKPDMPVRDGGLDLWAAVLSRASGTGASAELLSFLRGASVKNCTADTISLEVAGTSGPEVLSAARELVATSAEELLGRKPTIDIAASGFVGSSSPAGFAGIPRPVLNPKYTFENFVIGPSNRLGHAAALAVSENPGQAYNPLFIHSSSGMGKTHLLQATCRRLLEAKADTGLAYISCEDFQNLFFSAVQAGQLEAFRSRFRCAEVLVVDDIHFLANRERTQEEFFHTFNALYNAARQIILSSDCPPREIPQIQERLVSRFKWGLVAEIEPPTFETRLEIVRVKTQLRGFQFPQDVMEFIAQRSDCSIRELEGTVLKIVGYASLLGAPVDLDLAREVLEGPEKRGSGARPTSVDDIVAAVATYYGLSPSQIQARGRTRSIAVPRQICMYLARELTRHSLESIGAYFGGRDHSTVKHACDRVQEMINEGGEVAGAIRSTKQKLTNAKQ